MIKKIKIFFLTISASFFSIFNKNTHAAKLWLEASNLDPINPLYSTTAGKVLWQISKKFYAEKLFRLALKNNPAYVPALFNLAFILQEKNLHEQAVKLLSEVIEKEPNHDLAIYGRGLSNKTLGNNSEAISDFKSTIKLQPMAPHAYYHLSLLLFKSENFSELEDIIHKLSKFEPQVANQLKKELNIES